MEANQFPEIFNHHFPVITLNSISTIHMTKGKTQNESNRTNNIMAQFLGPTALPASLPAKNPISHRMISFLCLFNYFIFI